MQNEFLDLELRLLVLKHGRNRLWEGLARLEGTTLEEVERRLNELAKSHTPRKRKAPLSPDEAVAHLHISEKSLNDRLLTLAREYDQGRFLPQLRDAIRFCQLNGVKTRAKSRRDMLPKVVGILSTHSLAELDRLIEQASAEEKGDGSFARLANAIMRGT
ncbi:MAG: hypothetical protein QM796_21905 [Chthoniobacteraceae bacterium]